MLGAVLSFERKTILCIRVGYRGLRSHRINLVGVNADLLLILVLALELDLAVDERKQGVILADTDIVAGMDSGAALSDNDIAGNDGLTVSLLYAKTLRLTVAAVLGGTDTFFMCEKL